MASNLREPDYRECTEGYGADPKLFIPYMATIGHNITFHTPDGEIAGIAGVSPEKQVWMLCTPAIEKHPKTFIRHAKRWINERQDRFLWNFADSRNTAHLKLIQACGFTIGKEVQWGPNNVTFTEFYRVLNGSWRDCVNWRLSSGSSGSESERPGSS